VEARDQLLRLQADFDNFRKRALKERNEVLHYGHQNLVKELLSVVDNLERAIGHARASGGGDLGGFLQGVELVQRELLGALEKHGVGRVEALGQLFDPAVHEAMAQVPDAAAAPGTVLEVLQEGYRLRDRLLRPARVVVARPPEGNG
jgi:molecular chaperone GrpE